LIKLIINEISKIFNKKSTYVMFGLIFLFVVFTNYLYKTQLDETGAFKVDIYDSINLEYAIKTLEELDTSNPSNKTYELELRKNITEYKLYDKYGEYSWQAYIVQNDMYNLISDLIDNKYGKEKNQDELEVLEKEYNFYIEKFENDDWEYFVNEEIKAVNNKKKQLEELKENPRYTTEYINSLDASYNVELEVLNYRLENDISYAQSYINTALNNYLNAARNVKSSDIDYIKEQNKLYPNDRFLYNHYQNVSEMNVNKYILDNKIDANKINDSRGILINLFVEYEIYIIVFIVMICAGIVSSEFNKGTIKQLLLVPYTRIQILFSKYITCILMLLFIIFSVILMQVIIGGITFGFSSLSIPAVVYNFNNSSIEVYNIFYYLLIQILAKMPMFIILITLVFLMGTLTLNNALSIIFGIILYLTTPIISEIAANTSIEILNYLILPHWDFTQYLFGMITKNPYVNIGMSVPLCILYFLIAFIPTYVIFNKKDIKNM